ncbi:TerC family protein [Thermicanus aegyptius]|uniref:TerC family protein n=1 Tax=Thermicanus aegyptius TaxID=94009 RepID=UPI00041BE83C|nr:TerC family protein [Thermicanus aegyptius]
MELFSAGTMAVLASIIVINMVLSGDNAVVIALASRNLKGKLRKLAVLWGTAGAVLLRILLTVVIIHLLEIPFLQVLGGVMLLWIAYKLLSEEEEPKRQIQGGKTLWSAIGTIITADFIMSLDNVLAIAATANGSIPLIVIGISISVPIMIFGSQLVLSLMERFPIIVLVGVGILAWTAGEMILKDETMQHWLGNSLPAFQWILPLVFLLFILIVWFLKRRTLIIHPSK